MRAHAHSRSSLVVPPRSELDCGLFALTRRAPSDSSAQTSGPIRLRSSFLRA